MGEREEAPTRGFFIWGRGLANASASAPARLRAKAIQIRSRAVFTCKVPARIRAGVRAAGNFFLPARAPTLFLPKAIRAGIAEERAGVGNPAGATTFGPDQTTRRFSPIEMLFQVVHQFPIGAKHQRDIQTGKRPVGPVPSVLAHLDECTSHEPARSASWLD